MNKSSRENWGSRLGFVLAIAGSAIGLGNVWKFPYITGINGGGAFVLVYLLCVMLCGLPIMLCELAIGRHTGKNPVDAFKALQLRRSRLADVIAVLLLVSAILLGWTGHPGFGVTAGLIALAVFRWQFAAVGAFSIIAALLILSYYSVIGGWIIEYTRLAFSGQLNVNDVEGASQIFSGFISSPRRVIICHLIFLGLAGAMIWAGIRNGIERWSKILMPMLFVLLLAVILRSVTLPGAPDGIEFFLSPDFSKLTASSWLEALGHSFYTLSLGMAISITYGSYLKKEENIFTSALMVIGVDTMAALLAGLAIFPAVFAMGFEPGAGPSLIFKVLPATFNRMPGGIGWFWAGLFFLMLTIAALTSAASLFECGVTLLLDKFKMRRALAVVLIYVLVGGFGLLSCVSIVDWSNIEWLRQLVVSTFNPSVMPGDWFTLLDRVTSNWMIPLAGLLTALFTGWVWSVKRAARELRQGARNICDNNLITFLSGLNGDKLYLTSRNHGLTVMSAWGILIRYLTPLIVLLVFLKAIGVNVGF